MKESEVILSLIKMRFPSTLIDGARGQLERIREPAVFMHEARKRYYYCKCGSALFHFAQSDQFSGILRCCKCNAVFFINHNGDCALSLSRNVPFTNLFDGYLFLQSGYFFFIQSPNFFSDKKTGKLLEYTFWQEQGNTLLLKQRSFFNYIINKKYGTI